MALARGWLDVIGAGGFIFLALHAGHNANFVAIAAMRAAIAWMGGEFFARPIVEIATARAGASRQKNAQR
jgi:hypothetical protein